MVKRTYPTTLSGVKASKSPATTTTRIIRAVFCVIVPLTSRGVGMMDFTELNSPQFEKAYEDCRRAKRRAAAKDGEVTCAREERLTKVPI
jgi:hypothetical protein